MIKKEFLGHTLHIKGFKVEVKEENIKLLKQLGAEHIFEEKKKAKKNDSDK
jgi:hypothetical protein